MRVNLESFVNKSMTGLKRKLSRAVSELAALKKDLQSYENVQKMLFQDSRPGRTAKTKPRKIARTDWNAVLKKLPHSFTSEAFRKASGRNRSAVYPRQVLARWAKQHRIKRLARGKYKKA